MKTRSAAVEAQLCCEAIAFKLNHGYSVPVVATDLCTAIRVWRLEGTVLSEIFCVVGTPLTLNQGVEIIWMLIREQLPVVTAWLDAKSHSTFPRGNHDGSESGDASEPSSAASPMAPSGPRSAAAACCVASSLGGAHEGDGAPSGAPVASASLSELPPPTTPVTPTWTYTTTWRVKIWRDVWLRCGLTQAACVRWHLGLQRWTRCRCSALVPVVTAGTAPAVHHGALLADHILVTAFQGKAAITCGRCVTSSSTFSGRFKAGAPKAH